MTPIFRSSVDGRRARSERRVTSLDWLRGLAHPLHQRGRARNSLDLRHARAGLTHFTRVNSPQRIDAYLGRLHRVKERGLSQRSALRLIGP